MNAAETHEPNDELPGSGEDPNPVSTGYIMVLGFLTVLVSVFLLQYLVFNAVDAQRVEKAPKRSEALIVKQQQLELLTGKKPGTISIQEAMRRVVREYGTK